MEWSEILPTARLVNAGQVTASRAQAHRSEFERDYSRVLYSGPFRRLHNKTQVFPMPDNDHVHSRLTHSLEVSDVGRTLARKVGDAIISRHGLTGIDSLDVACIVSAACLAHDIGNPPFGHSGEDAFTDYFRRDESRKFTIDLTHEQLFDLQNWQGNAQGFRVLCRISDRYDNGGLQLTLPTIAAFQKYPQSSGHIDKNCGDVARKKFGFFCDDLPLYETVAESLHLRKRPGITSWVRHPLAFLTEAADDICYHILDLEDGVLLGLVKADELYELMQPIAQLDTAKYIRINRPQDQVTVLRALAITTLVDEIAQAFMDNETAILEGQFRTSLTDAFRFKDQLRAIKEFSFERCYRNEKVVRIELAGYNVIHCIMANLLHAAIDDKHKVCSLVKALYNDEYSFQVFLKSDKYGRILRIIDLVSGMTDRFAVKMFRELSGIELPVI